MWPKHWLAFSTLTFVTFPVPPLHPSLLVPLHQPPSVASLRYSRRVSFSEANLLKVSEQASLSPFICCASLPPVSPHSLFNIIEQLWVILTHGQPKVNSLLGPSTVNTNKQPSFLNQWRCYSSRQKDSEPCDLKPLEALWVKWRPNSSNEQQGEVWGKQDTLGRDTEGTWDTSIMSKESA